MPVKDIDIKEVEIFQLLWELERHLKNYNEHGYNANSEYFLKSKKESNPHERRAHS